jgi:ribokinase
MTKTVLFVGDVSLDLTMVADHVPAPDEKVHVDQAIEGPGGVVGNAAVACARAGATVRLLIQTGADAAASLVIAGMEAKGVAVEAHSVEGRTCRVVSIIEPHGEKRLLLDPGVSMYPGLHAVEVAELSGVGWVHTAVYGPSAERLVERARLAGIPWSLDLEPASFKSGIGTLSAMIDGAAVIFCNERAAAAIGPDAASTLLKLGARAVVRTLGPAGAHLLAADADILTLPPQIGRVIDTTGAGDCLAGWFIGETLLGASRQTALAMAVSAASLSCRNLGAQDSFPDRNDVVKACPPPDPASTNRE